MSKVQPQKETVFGQITLWKLPPAFYVLKVGYLEETN